MITIKFLHHISGLPLKGRSILIIFTDTVFGWLAPGMTDDDGMVAVRSGPGPARVYVDGELLGSQKLRGDMLAYLDEEGVVSWDKESKVLGDTARQQVLEDVEQACPEEAVARKSGKKEQIRA